MFVINFSISRYQASNMVSEVWTFIFVVVYFIVIFVLWLVHIFIYGILSVLVCFHSFHWSFNVVFMSYFILIYFLFFFFCLVLLLFVCLSFPPVLNFMGWLLGIILFPWFFVFHISRFCWYFYKRWTCFWPKRLLKTSRTVFCPWCTGQWRPPLFKYRWPHHKLGWMRIFIFIL